jgi:hypothetical protein
MTICYRKLSMEIWMSSQRCRSMKRNEHVLGDLGHMQVLCSDVLALASGQKPGQARPKKARARPGQRVWLRLAYGLAWIMSRPEPVAWAMAL